MSDSSPERGEKGFIADGFAHEISATDPTSLDDTTQPPASTGELHRGLKSRHITMIAIGGAIGTGLIIGTGSALAKAGPGSILISYSMVGFLVFLVMGALGEMAAWLPMASGFTARLTGVLQATLHASPTLLWVFALGYTYWFKYIITTPNNLTAAALVIQYWVPRSRVNPGVWITIFLVTIVVVNYFGVRFFGELEFWLSSLKVLVIVGLIILCIVLAAGGGPNHHAVGFQYWKSPGAFKPYIDTTNIPLGRFYGFWATMVTAVFAFLGTELVGVTVGEAQNPRKTIPRAIRLTFWRILVFYIFSVLLVGMLVPYDSKDLAFATKASTSAAASPFVVAITMSGIPVLPGFLNACILIFVTSAANSDLYIATRTIYGLAREKKAPAFLAKTNKAGVPIWALAVSSLFLLLAYLNVSDDSKNVFIYFVNLVSIFGLLTWISILVSHISFVRARRAQGIPDTALAYTATFGIWGSYGALAFCIIIALTKNFDVFTWNNGAGFDYKNFITGYLGIPLYLLLIAGWKIFVGSERVRPETADLYTGKDKIDREEEEYLAQQAARAHLAADESWFYRTFISWLF